MNGVSAPISPPSRFTPTKYSSNLTWSWPASASPNLIDYSLQVHLQTLQILASMCISNFAWSQPPSVSPNLLDHILQVHFQTRTLMASKFAQSLSQSASLSLLHRFVVTCCSLKADRLTSRLRRTWHSIRWQFLKKCHTGSQRVATGWEDMRGYTVMQNHTKCLNLCTLGKSAWGITQIEWINESWARASETKSWERKSVYFV